MFEAIKEFIMHPIQTTIDKVLNKRQKEKVARFKEKEDRAMEHIAKHTIEKAIKDDEKLEVLRNELETRSKIQRILSAVRLIVIFILLIFLLCGRKSL